MQHRVPTMSEQVSRGDKWKKDISKQYAERISTERRVINEYKTQNGNYQTMKTNDSQTGSKQGETVRYYCNDQEERY